MTVPRFGPGWSAGCRPSAPSLVGTGYECQGMERAKDHVAEATIVGTAITRFTRNRQPARTATLAVMSLGERPVHEIKMINLMMRSSE